MGKGNIPRITKKLLKNRREKLAPPGSRIYYKVVVVIQYATDKRINK